MEHIWPLLHPQFSLAVPVVSMYLCIYVIQRIEAALTSDSVLVVFSCGNWINHYIQH